MTGRPSKTTVDYFPHQTTHKKTIFTLESLYGNDGYAFWFKLLEILGSSDSHYFRYEKTADWLFLVAKTGVSEEKAEAILNTLADLEAIDRALLDEKTIWSDNFVNGLIPVYDKRSTELPIKPILRRENQTAHVLSGEKTPQSKVNKTKVTQSKEEEDGAEENTRPCPHLKIIDLYNKILSKKLPQVKPSLWNGIRKKHLAVRWKEAEERQSLQWWKEYFETVSENSFLCGENDRGWIADLGWLVNQSNIVKVLEGNYSSRIGAAKSLKDCSLCLYNQTSPCKNFKKDGFDRSKCCSFTSAD